MHDIAMMIVNSNMWRDVRYRIDIVMVIVVDGDEQVNLYKEISITVKASLK